MTDGDVEEPLEARQLPVLPMYLVDDCLVEVLEEPLAEEEVEVVDHFDIDDVDVEEHFSDPIWSFS